MKRVYAQVCLVSDYDDDSVEGTIIKKLKEMGFTKVESDGDRSGETIQGEMDIVVGGDMLAKAIPQQFDITVRLELQVEDVEEDEEEQE